VRNCMIKTIQKVILLMCCGAPSIWGVQDTLKLENTGANYVMGGVYTSPYGVSINGGPPALLICDDFTTDVSLNQTWTATVTSLAELQAGTNPSNTPKFTPASVAKYATAAVLAAELVSLSNPASELAGEYSFAIWDIFDPTLLNSLSSPYGTITQTELDAAKAFLQQAQDIVASVTTSGVVNLSALSVNGTAITGLTIYTPDPLTSSQEFLQVSMPEPTYPAVLALDLLAVVGLIVAFRRRIACNFK